MTGQITGARAEVDGQAARQGSSSDVFQFAVRALRVLRSFHWILLIAIILTGSSVRMSFWDQDVGGKNTFRQGHVVNDVISFMATWDGPELEPLERFDKTWGIGLRLFDAPIFQIFSAAIADVTPLSPVNSARAVSLASFAITTAAVFWIGRFAGRSKTVGLLAAAIFAFSPLSMHYFGAPLPDTLSIALSMSSVVALVKYVRTRRKVWLFVAIALIMPAVIIKPPSTAVALGGAGSYIAYRWATRRESLFSCMSMGIYFLAAVVAAVSFSALLAQVNWDQWTLPPAQRTWYFGSIEQRLHPENWRMMASIARREFGPQEFVFVFGLLGAGILATRVLLRRAWDGQWMILGMVGGMLLSTLVFFNVTHLHNYYLLPALPPFAIISALGIHRTVRFLMRTKPVALALDRWYASAGYQAQYRLTYVRLMVSVITISIGIFFVPYSIQQPVLNYHWSTLKSQEGQFVREHVSNSGFVLYWTERNPSPQYHYYLK
ncbi:MAG: hypothetical protein WD208_11800 [Dehalococcoidia bacterium]